MYVLPDCLFYHVFCYFSELQQHIQCLKSFFDGISAYETLHEISVHLTATSHQNFKIYIYFQKSTLYI